MDNKETRTVTCPECGVVRTKEFSLVRAGELRRAGDISKCHSCAGRLGGRGKMVRCQLTLDVESYKKLENAVQLGVDPLARIKNLILAWQHDPAVRESVERFLSRRKAT